MAVVVAWVLQGGGVAVAVAPGGGVEALVALHAASARTSTTVRVGSLVAASRRAVPGSVIVNSMARSFCAKRPVPRGMHDGRSSARPAVDGRRNTGRSHVKRPRPTADQIQPLVESQTQRPVRWL